MKTKKVFALLALSSFLFGCAQKIDYKLIKPLPAGYSVENLKDCTVPASFRPDDFRWIMADSNKTLLDENRIADSEMHIWNGMLSMNIFNKDLYDAVEISQIKVGDTLIYESQPMVVNTIEKTDGGISINGGLEEGGCWLVGHEGGTYVAKIWDDHAVYTNLGKAEVALAEDFVIIDCGLDPRDPNDTIRTNQKLYLENLKDSRRDFHSLNTLVTIENGKITEIIRRWIP